MKIDARYHWRNWLGNQQCVAARYRPATSAELEAALKAEEPTHVRTGLRPVGLGAGWSALVPTTGALIARQRGKRSVTRLPGTNRIRVDAGMTLRELVAGAKSHGLTVRGLPIYLDLTVGGCLAVGAHGTGQRWGTMSDYLEALEVILPSGERKAFQKTDPEWPALGVSLGALGVIVSATLECEPTFNVRVERGFLARDMMEHLEDVLDTYEFVEIYWFMTEETVWVELMNRTDAHAPTPTLLSRIWRKLSDGLTQLIFAPLLPLLARWFPRAVRRVLGAINDLMSPTERDRRPRWIPRAFLKLFLLGRKAKAMAERWAFGWVTHFGSEVMTAEEAFHYIHSVVKSWDSEFCIEAKPEGVKALWDKVCNAIQDEEAEGRHPVNLGLHVRFVDASSPLLSPANGRKSCYLEVVTLKGTPGAEKFYRQFQDLALANKSARPHWGKYFDPAGSEEICAHYKDVLEAFRDTRRALDPEGRFLNELLERCVK